MNNETLQQLADAIAQRMQPQPQPASQAAALKGASSAWLAYMVGANRYEQLAADVEAAAQGKGSLLD